MMDNPVLAEASIAFLTEDAFVDIDWVIGPLWEGKVLMSGDNGRYQACVSLDDAGFPSVEFQKDGTNIFLESGFEPERCEAALLELAEDRMPLYLEWRHDQKWVLLDIDDVCFDIVGPFADYLRDELSLPVEGLPGSWNMGPWMGCSEQEALQRIMEFNEHSDRFGNLPALPWTKPGLQKIVDAGYRIAMITASSSGESSKRRRIANLMREFPGLISEIHFVGLGQSKAPLLDLYPREWQVAGYRTIYVDDSKKNAEVGAELGFMTLLFPAHHNAEAIAMPPAGVIAISGGDALLEMIPGISLPIRDPSA